MYFSHSGDIGDIIYALPAIKAKGGGHLKLFNFPYRTYQPMTLDRVNKLKELLEYQDYIFSCTFSETMCDTSLNGFRDHLNQGNTSDAALATQGLDWTHRIDPWLQVPKSIFVNKTIIAWTERHHSFDFPWDKVVDKYKPTYIGFKEDHSTFCNKYGSVDFVDLNTFMEIACVISACELYVGNLTSCTAVAEGLKKNMVVESYHYKRLHDFTRPGLIVANHERIVLP
jgi:hypothetical protein